MNASARSRRFRWLAIVYGILIFVWLSPEDNHVWPVALLGTGASGLLVIYLTHTRLQTIPRRYLPLSAALMGAIIGVGASIITVILMLFKNVRHSHVFLDYPVGLMGAVLARAPLWALVGGLIGLGVGLAWLVLIRDNST